MSAKILNGKDLAIKLKEELRQQISSLKRLTHLAPRIASIVVGNDASSHSYVLSQQKAAEEIGIRYELQKFPDSITESELVNLIYQMNDSKDINGIILNKPMPESIDFKTCVNTIDPIKDIEGMGLANLGRLFLGKSPIAPCTAAAAMTLLRSSGVSLKGKEAVVIGRSEIVGKPVALLLLEEHVTTTICHSATSAAGKLEEHLKRADIIIAAIGKPRFVKGSWVKAGAIVIDVGINQEDGKIVGDLDYDSVKDKAGFITPVPGGVGPVTSVMLMQNVVEAYKQQFNI